MGTNDVDNSDSSSSGGGGCNEGNNTKPDDGPTSIFPIPAAQRVKRNGFDFYENTLGAPKYVVSLIIKIKLFIFSS